MNRHGMKILASVIGVMGLVQAPAWGSEGPQERAGRREPPPEAVEACKNKSEGEIVEFTSPRGDKIKATCRQIGGQLAAVPEGGPRGPQNGPPQGERSK